MDKYNVRFCECGRVHFIEWKILNRVCDTENKKVLFICNNCGKTDLQFLDDYLDGKVWTSIPVENEMLEGTDVGLVITSRGERIWMKSGGYATSKVGTIFIDWDTPSNKCSEESRKIVDTQKTIRMIDDEEKLEELSHYGVDIHWKGTKYEKSYNK